MKRLIYIFALTMLTVMPAKAGFIEELLDFVDAAAMIFNNHASWNDYYSDSFIVYYDSYDGQKNKVRLSAKVYYIDNGLDVDRIILACHPTVTDNKETPTGYKPVDGDVQRMTISYTGGAMVVCPDYCGYGLSSNLQHPYLINDVTARNCIDAVIAAMGEITKHGRELDDDYETDIVGYSQGGATALACTKYLESDACPQDIKNKIRLAQTSCGDGPYSPVATVNKYLEWGNPNGANEDMEYACVLPLIVAAAKDAYGEGCMRTVKIEDFFSDKFNQAGILNLIKTKSVDTGVLDAEISKAMNGRKRPVDVFSSNIINADGTFNTKTNEYKCLMRALDMADLTKGWTPTHPIFFYHLECDKTVPYANFEEVFKSGHIGDGNSNVRKVNTKKALDDVAWAVKWKKDLLDVDLNHISHAAGGVVFYVSYMFGDYVREW